MANPGKPSSGTKKYPVILEHTFFPIKLNKTFFIFSKKQ